MTKYQEQQDKWVADNNIAAHSKVRVQRIAKSWEDGWGNFWAPSMNDTVEHIGTVIMSRFDQAGILVDMNMPPTIGTAYFPYFVLEKVTNEKESPLRLPKLDKEEDGV